MIYLSENDNTTEPARTKALDLIVQAHTILDGLAGQQFESEFDSIFDHLESALRGLEDVTFNQGE